MDDEVVVLMRFASLTDKVVLSGLEMDYRAINPNGVNLVWSALPGTELIALKGYEFVIRNDDGQIKVIRRRIA